jgi:hypothetical protein
MTALARNIARDVNSKGCEKRYLYQRLSTGAIYEYALVAQRFDSDLCEPVTERPDLIVRGIALAKFDNPAASTTNRVPMIAGRIAGFDNSAGDDAITASDYGRLVYAVDTNTLARTDGDTGGGPTRSPAGFFGGFTTKAGVQTLVLVVPDDFETAIMMAQDLGGGGSVSPSQESILHTARGVVLSNVADVAAFTVSGSGRDGLTYAEGEIVLLAAQTTGAQSGPYVVGEVTTGVAPLTRPAWWAAVSVQAMSSEFNINAGTVFAGSKWYATVAGAITVDTTAPAFYPRIQKGVSSAMTGTPGAITVTGLWIHTGGQFIYARKTTGGTPGHISIAVTAGAGDGQVVITSTGNETSTIGYAAVN